MLTHREIIEKMPFALAKRPRNERGYPVPWFVPFHNGQWDFRFVRPEKIPEAVSKGICWTCGEPLERPYAFVLGPMCAVNRTSAEPPSHVQCAIYAARACPFLARPKLERLSARTDLDKSGNTTAGIMLDRNPGVALVWVTNQGSYDPTLRLFDIGDPVRVRWYAHSRKATREEVMESITTGLPFLRNLAMEEGHDAVQALEAQVERAMPLVPAEETVEESTEQAEDKATAPA